ncbi:MAG: serine/threonine protein kinase, partial [Acidobacteria bacterium]|nr:serine/threonine protein kinase [Acidobacteriota bacterium]
MNKIPNYIGHYRIISEIGRGGMGVVYKAEEESLDRFVAVKVLGEHLTQDEGYVKRFQREAQAAARLNHPNIVQIYFIGEDDGRHYFAMEYVSGQSLQEILRIRGKLPPGEAIQLVLQAASGLAAAHAAGIIHRDIKPANLMITREGHVKITDFGLARPTEAATRLTATGMLMGTPAYLAPEQCLDKTIDQRADIFSLGVTLFEMVTGRRPFEASSPVALLKIIADAVPPALDHVSADPDDPLRRILARMLAKDPGERYQSCRELIPDLSRWPEASPHADDHAAAAVPVPPPPTGGVSPEALAQTPTIHVDSAASPPPPPRQAPAAEPRTPPPPPAQGGRRTAVWIVLAIVLLVGALATAGVIAWHTGIFQNMVALMHGRSPAAPAATAAQTPAATPVADQSGAPETFVDTSGVEISSGRQAAAPSHEGRQSDDAGVPAASVPAAAGSHASPTEPPGGAFPAAAAVQQPAPTPRTTGIAVVAVGEPVIATAAEQYLVGRLRQAGLEALTSRDFHSLDGLSSRSGVPSTGEIVDRLRGEAAIAVIIRATYLGSRPLVYMGRTDQAFQSRLDVLGIDLGSGAELMPAWTKTVEYT